MLLMSRRKTTALMGQKKEKDKCRHCKRSNSARPAKNSVVEEKKLPPAPSAAPPSAPMESIKNNDLDDLQFPDVPSSFTRPPGGSPPGSGGDLDLDDLARRFDQLKKK